MKPSFQRQQCLHLHFKRLQYLQSFMLSKDDNIFMYFSKTSTSFVFYWTQCPCLCFIGLDVLCFYALKKKKEKRRTPDVFHSTEFQCPHVFLVITPRARHLPVG